MALSLAVAGRVSGFFLAPANGLPHFSQKHFVAVHHQSIGKAQQPYAPSSKIVFLRRVLPHLAGLRVNRSVKFAGQALLEAIEIDDPVFEAALAAELCAQPSATQEIPRRAFGVSLVPPQSANALGGDAHGASIAELSE